MSSIWIIDDEPVICSILQKTFKALGHGVCVFSAAEPAIAIASQNGKHSLPDLIIMDVRLPGIDGLEAIVKISAYLPKIPIVVVTAFGDLPTAVRAMEAKVFEYLTKPFDLETAIAIVERGLASQSPVFQESSCSEPPAEQSAHELELLGTSPAMQALFKSIAMAAISDCPILIRGESGTGKELVARAIHRHSSRRSEPYLAIAPVTVNPSLIESELFGHERGAFTGAEQARRGVFELAGRGTILLDEIGDLPLAQQVKLLRVLEQREYFPVGSNKAKEVQARVIAATHRDLSQMVVTGNFREDLFFRLAVFTIDVPSLRERPSDIVPLAVRFLSRHGYSAGRSVLSNEVIAVLETYVWPGNVRELRNAMDHAAVLARGNRIHAEHLPNFGRLKLDGSDANSISFASRFDELIRSWVDDQTVKSEIDGVEPLQTLPSSDLIANEFEAESLYEAFLRTVEPPLLRALLESCQGNKAAVAQKLGLHRSTLRQKMRAYEFDS